MVPSALQSTGLLSGEALWSRVLAATESALACRALQSIPTRCTELPDTAATFQVRVVENLARKSREIQARANQQPQAGDVNPFLPYNEALYVGQLTPRYRCLLNKFNVVDHHILMVTTEFAEQLEPLTKEDFLVAAICLQARDGLVFYNGGPEAGASVRHKHLQMIPLPMSPDNAFPFAELLEAMPLRDSDVAEFCPALPFPHSIIRAEHASVRDQLNRVAAENYRRYQRLLAALTLSPCRDGMMPPHNLLQTRDCLWAVPRRMERYRGIAVNALGFTGALLVKDEVQLQQLRVLGGMPLLKQVAG